jgi:hypothetical protein
MYQEGRGGSGAAAAALGWGRAQRHQGADVPLELGAFGASLVACGMCAGVCM